MFTHFRYVFSSQSHTAVAISSVGHIAKKNRAQSKWHVSVFFGIVCSGSSLSQIIKQTWDVVPKNDFHLLSATQPREGRFNIGSAASSKSLDVTDIL